MRRELLGLVLLGLASCTRSEAKRDEATSAAATKVVGALKFHEDSYDRALAEARRRKVPLFIDAWAPWCHTCLSFKAYVLSDPSLAPLADRFVWLSVDTEKAENAAFLKKFPLDFWPTLWVVDPKDESAIVKWPGSLNLGEFRELLDDAASAVGGPRATGAAAEALLRAEQAAAGGKRDVAIENFRTAMAQAPAGWPRRARAVDGLVTALHGADRAAECAATARAELGSLTKGTSQANVALYGLMCARKGSDAEATRAAAAEVERVVQDEAQPMLADDRSSLYEELIDARKKLGDRDGARRAASDWSAYLEKQATSAATPEARRVFDAHRMVADLELGEHGKALAMLEQSEREDASDYNTPARIAKVQLEAGRLDEALVAIDRSLKLAYGPRRLRLWDLKARILEKKGDAAGARAAREQGVREGEAMKLEGKQARALDDLRGKLAR